MSGILLLYHGGDFAGITQKLDYLEDLGINTIWITPIVENIPGVTVTDTEIVDAKILYPLGLPLYKLRADRRVFCFKIRQIT